MTAVYLLIRSEGEGEPPAYVRAYRTRVDASKAQDMALAYLTSPARPPHPQGSPEGFTVRVAVGSAPTYKASSSDKWLAVEDSRILYTAAWALYDARKAAYQWWLQANPVDRGAPEGSTYTVETVEYTDA